MPISFLEEGKTGTIKQILGKDDVKKHIQDIGFIVGGEVIVVSKLGGNLIVNVKGARVAIDCSMAKRIIV